ncbi:AMP-dependent synthetase and ligase [Sistotremastrum niveocremeum HHB9708]|uniref:AMP-dependent synthetase and ligase n=1 Tax=Sistotremastrum niveocremeum HHB9708 TaxID=1314777 RepID=A0A164U5E5_9AGAM|nr:AMP-dependent synthetase and ligase [Sistotremastrum niveocremeum HHB9708]
MYKLPEHFRPTPESLPPKDAILRLAVPEGLPVNITPLNPLVFLIRAAAIFPDKVALVHHDVPNPVTYNYAIWAQRIQNLAYALIEAGIKPGDRVAVIAPNWYADAHHGILAARAVITPINIRLTKGEVDYILNHSGAKFVLVDHEFAHLVQGTSIPTIISEDSGKPDDPYEQFLASGRKFSQENGWLGLAPEKDENAVAALCYTFDGFLGPLNRESVYLWQGWTFPWANTFAMATQVTLRTVSYPHIWKHLLHSGISHYCGAPTVQISIAAAPEARRLAKPVKAIIAGSAPTAALIGELENRNIKAIHVYANQTYGPFTRNYERPHWSSLDIRERSKLMSRQGHGFATSDEARVVVQTDGKEISDVPMDGLTVGEIVVRGNIVMKEYFNDPEATKTAFRGGYFHSGDLAVRHSDGSVAIIDRSKDLIISGGENVSSLAVEQALAAHPDVLEASVVARSHPKWGERPMAFIILRIEAIEKWADRHHHFAADLKQFARNHLPGFALPEWIKVVPELPKTSTGKILKHALRKEVAKL